MAHAGKYYPFAMMNDWAWIPFGGYVPPRKMRLITTATSTGTLTVPWRNLTIISTLADRHLDSNFIRYEFHHPTVADNFWRVDWVFAYDGQVAPLSTPWKVTLEHSWWHQGTRYGTAIGPVQQTEMFLGADRLAIIVNFWQNRIDIPKFAETGFCKVCAARWEDQPDYHPWRP
jgi:hypothetical protein